MSALSLRGRFDAAEGPGPERGRAEPRREKPCKKNTAESFDCFVHAFSPHMVITRFFKRNRAKTPLHFFIGRRYPRRLRRRKHHSACGQSRGYGERGGGGTAPARDVFRAAFRPCGRMRGFRFPPCRIIRFVARGACGNFGYRVPRQGLVIEPAEEDKPLPLRRRQGNLFPARIACNRIRCKSSAV